MKDRDGDLHDPGNFRPIALLSQLFKLYEAILNNRIINHLEGFDKDGGPKPKLCEEQNGFRPGRGCLDNLYLIRELALDQKFMQRGRKPLLLAFLDIRKAFDRVCRPILWDRLFKKGINGRMWRVLKKLYSGFKGRAKIGSDISNPFRIDTGVVQGSRLGPTLFNIFFDDLITKFKLKFKGAQFSFGTSLPILAYADDLVLISNDPTELQKMLDFVSKYALENEFEFNNAKSKILKLSKKCSAHFNMGGQRLEEVEHYRYLGVPLGRSMHAGARPSPFRAYFERINRKARARSMVARYLGARRDGLRPKTAVKLYKSLTRPIFEYGSPVLIFGKSHMVKLEVLQNFILKRSMGLLDNTKTESVRVVTGIESLAARFAFLKLKHARRIMLKPKTSLVRVVFEQIRVHV